MLSGLVVKGQFISCRYRTQSSIVICSRWSLIASESSVAQAAWRLLKEWLAHQLKLSDVIQLFVAPSKNIRILRRRW